MCTTGVGIAMIVGAALSTAASVAGNENAAASRKRMAQYQTDTTLARAQTAQYEAQNARVQARYDAAALRREFLQAQGTQRSLLAANGVDMAGGSALDVLLDNASEAAREREYRLYQGELEAWRYENQARSLLAQSGASDLLAGVSGSGAWSSVQTGASLLTRTGGTTGTGS